jgi:DNA-binding NarL/FixJ family response regulator
MRNGKHKVLLLNDQPLVREGLALLINQEADLEVCGFSDNARSAFKAMAKLKPDIVVIDIFLDGRDTLELIKEIGNLFPRLPVLVLSMHQEAIYAEHALRAGAKGYVLVQDMIPNIMKGIRQVLKGKIYLSKILSEMLLKRFVDVLSGVENAGAGRLSDRELLILRLIGKGLTTRQIAEKLCVSIKTVETYRARVKKKLNLNNHIDLLHYAIKWTTTLREIEQ